MEIIQPSWGSQFKFANGSIATASLIGRPYVDRTNMSVRATISTMTRDRVGDVLLPRGCDLTNYSKNPCVMWGHGIEGISFPIATSNDPDGNLSVVVTDLDVSATAYFSQSLPEAVQIFELIDEGIVKATSVRETPRKSRRILDNGEPYDYVELWELEEYSFAALGVNPDALCKCIDKNRLDGRPIYESILKSLSAACPKPSKPGIGFEESQMKNPNDTDDDGENKDVKPADDKLTTADFAEQAPADQIDTTKSEDGQPMEAEVQGDPKEDSKLGRQGLSYVDDSCKSMRAGIRGICKSLEQPDVKGHLEDIHDRLGSMIDDNKGARDDHYPTSSSLKDEDMGDGEADDSGDDSSDSDSDMKSFLVQSFTGRNQLSAVSTRLKSLAKSTRLTVEERKKLESDILAIDTLRSQAKSHPKPKPKEQKAVVKSVPVVEKTPEVPAEDPVKLAELAAKLKSMQDQIKSAKA